MKKIFQAFYIAAASLLGFDVRFNRKGEARFHLRDRKADRKAERKARKKVRVRRES